MEVKTDRRGWVRICKQILRIEHTIEAKTHDEWCYTYPYNLTCTQTLSTSRCRLLLPILLVCRILLLLQHTSPRLERKPQILARRLQHARNTHPTLLQQIHQLTAQPRDAALNTANPPGAILVQYPALSPRTEQHQFLQSALHSWFVVGGVDSPLGRGKVL